MMTYCGPWFPSKPTSNASQMIRGITFINKEKSMAVEFDEGDIDILKKLTLPNGNILHRGLEFAPNQTWSRSQTGHTIYHEVG